MQRDVEFEVESIDKSGGFIGSLYLNKTENAALALVKEGLATIHSFSAEGLSWAKQLFEAEVCHRGLAEFRRTLSNKFDTGGSKESQEKCSDKPTVLSNWSV